MWETPIYKFKIDLNGKKEQIYIDVTGSAPNFSVPGKQLESTFDELLKGLNPNNTKILDFGSAKLRNTLYLLKKGYTVYSCEFEDLFNRSKQANDFLGECKKYQTFKRLIFPNDFIDAEEEFDVILLINVLNVMPVPIERYCVLALCREKIRENGRLLWYTQHGAYSENSSVARLFDGLVTGKGREYKMFYRDFSRREILDMLTANGFSFSKNFHFTSAGTNQAYTFIADGDVLVDKSLRLTEQLRNARRRAFEPVQRKTWKTKEEETDPSKRLYETTVPTKANELESINVLENYIMELDSIKKGKEHASKYHKLIFNILKIIFDKRLRKPEMEEYLAKDTQRADITFQNQRECGFFKQLDEGYHITCPNIFVECKNYEGDIGNPEFAQIQNRLNKVRGQFGILSCRNIIDCEKAEKRQANLKSDEKYVIVLTDEDMKTLAKFSINNREDEIDNYLEMKFKWLI
jgi:hypothetical protein